MSIFKATFPQGVQEQLTTRQNKMLARDTTTIKYLNSRTAWIRMTSAVNTGASESTPGSSDLAKNNIMLGGVLSNNSLRHGVGTTGTEAYSIKTPSGTNHRLGIKPMPGITGLEVKSKGAYGSLREVTVKFQCWDIHQLEELELLYMRPGYSVLVEWGWVPYLDNSGNLKTDIPLNDDVLNGGKNKEEIWKAIHKKASSNGNYDAEYGLIKNYKWSARADGGYDCSTEIITVGEIAESLKVNYCDSETNIASTGLFNVIEDPEYFKKGSDINTSYNRSKLAGILNEMWLIGKNFVTVGGAGSFGTKPIELPKGSGINYNFLRYDIDISRSDTMGSKDSFVEEQQQIYIKLKDFVEILNKYVLLHEEEKIPLLTLSVQEGEHNGGDEGDPLLCLGNKLQLSVNPSICLIKNPAWADPQGALGITPDGTDMETIKQIMTDIPEDYFLDGDFSDKQLGIIGNIYINLGYLYSLITDDELASQDKKEKKEISLYNYVKSILSGVNTSIGNVANLDLFVDPVDSVARIIDLNYVNKENKIDTFILEMHNLQSTVRSYKLESQIFPDQTSTIAIGAQTKGGALGTDTTTLVDFNKGLEDRIIPSKEMPRSSINNPESEEEAYKTNLDLLLSYINKSDPSWYEHAGDFDASEAGKFANALRDIINYRKAAIKDNNKNKAIIPTKVSIEMDGIGGIVIGNIFRIPNELLPKGYQGDSVGAKVAYVVTELGSSVQNNDWITKISAQYILLDGPSGADKNVWDNAKFNSLAKTTIQNVVKVVTPTPPPTPSDPPTPPTPPTTTSTKASKAKKVGKCTESYEIFSSKVANLKFPVLPSWSQIKSKYTFPSAIGIKAIGTPYDSGVTGVDFAYKMKNSRVSKRPVPNSVDFIILHYTADNQEYNDPTVHYRSTWEGREASADFTVARNGTIAGFKSFKTYKSWHYGYSTMAQSSKYINKNNPNGWYSMMNGRSVGIEIVSAGPTPYCKSTNNFLDYDGSFFTSDINKINLLDTPYRGYNMWHVITEQQIYSLFNLIIAIYSSGIISDKTIFLANCTGTNRYNVLFPDNLLKSFPCTAGILTHGTSSSKGKMDVNPQKNLLQMLDDLPNYLNSKKIDIKWTI